MLGSTVLDYFCGLLISYARSHPDIPNARTRRLAKSGVAISVIGNLVILGIFKYFNFAVDIFQNLFASLGWNTPSNVIQIVLPLGISFYTFQSMSYTIDVYRGRVEPTRNFLNFSCFVTMFPQLVAGPIIRYRDIENQIVNRDITVRKFSSGVQRFIIGLAKKVLVANTVAVIVDRIFAFSPNELTRELAWLGISFYSLQIYFDFSGYSDMAIGLGRMLGFDFLENFNYPYIAQSIRDFWRRWHISLSNWFKDYLYIPLGGNRISQRKTYINLAVVFFLVGLWHGAAWRFVVWGAYHGVFLIIERGPFGKFLRNLLRPLRHLYTLLAVMIGWVFFRADSLEHAFYFLKCMMGFAGSSGRGSFDIHYYLNNEVVLIILIGILGSTPIVPVGKKIYAHIFRERQAGAIGIINLGLSLTALLSFMAIFMYSIMSLANQTYNPFIYFRF